MKKRVISNINEAKELESAVRKSARKSLEKIQELYIETGDALRTLSRMKFDPIGFDPLDQDRQLNLIEQINQTFTYVASARAVELLFKLHPDLAPFTLNLGNVRGTDIESGVPGALACEVFASVKPSNNKKLTRDIANVSKKPAAHKYVFFMCPDYKVTQRQDKLGSETGVQVWSVRPDL